MIADALDHRRGAAALQVLHYAIYAAMGGVTYWAPDILVQWLRPPFLIWISLLTFGAPAVLGLSWLMLSNREPHRKHPLALPLFMLLGIWALGPLAIAVGTVPAGGTYLEAANCRQFLALWLWFPMTTIMMATYSGSLGGLGIATLFLLIAAIAKGMQLLRPAPCGIGPQAGDSSLPTEPSHRLAAQPPGRQPWNT